MPSPEKEPSVDATPSATEPSAEATVIAKHLEEVTRPAAEKEPSGEMTLSTTEKKLAGEISSAAPIGRSHLLDGNNQIRHVLGVPDPGGAVLFMVLVSLLYSLLTPWLLCRVAGHQTAFVWTASLLACSYFSIGTMCLSETMGFFTVLFRISCVILMAIAGGHLIGPITGAAIASLTTFYAAGTFGYAIGEYLQSVGGEKSTDGAARTPPFRDEEHQRRREETICYFCFLQGTLSLFIVARMVWVLLVPASVIFLITSVDDHVLFVVEELSLETLLLAWWWCSFLALILLEKSAVSVHTMICRIPACLVAFYTLDIVLSITVCKVAGLLVIWPVPMALVGLFGYCLAVYDRYKQIRARNQTVPIGIYNLSLDGPANNEHDRHPLV
ncbi:hypothetical protein ACP70R_003944 [Stipagrostis hirtigluma subsp. patula]